MSKKAKKKLKSQKAAVIQQSQSLPNPIQTEDHPELLPEVAPKTSTQVTAFEPKKQNEFLPEVDRVRKDIRKIAIVVGTIVILLIAATVADNKTGWILKFADWVSNLNF